MYDRLVQVYCTVVYVCVLLYNWSTRPGSSTIDPTISAVSRDSLGSPALSDNGSSMPACKNKKCENPEHFSRVHELPLLVLSLDNNKYHGAIARPMEK